jgi:hypothetical protein
VYGGVVCVGGGGRAFYYTYLYSRKRESCEGADLVSVLVAETIEGGGEAKMSCELF